MNIKLSVFLFALLISSSSLFYSCQTTAEKKDEAAEEVVEAKEELAEANVEFAKAKQEWQNSINLKIIDWDNRMDKIDAKIEEQGDAISVELRQEHNELKANYQALKTDLEQTESKTEGEWAEFKADLDKTAGKVFSDINAFFNRIDVDGDGK